MIPPDTLERLKKSPENLVRCTFSWCAREVNSHPEHEREALRALIAEAKLRNGRYKRPGADGKKVGGRSRKKAAGGTTAHLPFSE